MTHTTISFSSDGARKLLFIYKTAGSVCGECFFSGAGVEGVGVAGLRRHGERVKYQPPITNRLSLTKNNSPSRSGDLFRPTRPKDLTHAFQFWGHFDLHMTLESKCIGQTFRPSRAK